MNTPDNTFRLTSLQQELWISHESLHEKHPGISCGGKFLLNGYPNSEILLKALKLSLKSQSLLTATLRQDDHGIPFLKTGVFTEPDYQIFDLRNDSNAQAALNKILDDFTEKKFEPVGGKLCRFALVYTDNNSWFLSRFFHLIADGIACLAHFHFLSSIYEKVGTDTEADFGESLSWHNDVEEDLNHIGSPRYQKDIEFYKNYLSDLPEERIFTPKPGKIDKIEEVKRLDLQMSIEATERIRSLTKYYGGGITRVLTALHALLITRLYDRDKISIQTPIRYGERKDLLNIIGHRVNFIPTIFNFSKFECFKDLTDRIGTLMREFPKRVRTPFQHALRKMTREQSDLSFLWDTNINYIPKLTEEKMGDIDVKALCPVTSKYDPVLLGIYIIEGCSEEDGLHFDFVYSENHFSEKDIRNYLKRIDKLTIQILENPDKKIEDFDILTDEEKTDIAIWEKGAVQGFQIDTITGLFDKTAQLYPSNQAVCDIHGEKTDYRSLKERSDSISVWLNSLGVEPGKVVAVLASRHFRLPELILGIMKAGGVYLPVDPAYPSQRIKYILDDSKAQIIIALDDRVPRELQVNAIQLPELLPAGIPDKMQNINEAAYLIYTSGSSGTPKGVLLSHAAFINMVQGQISLFGVNAKDRVLQFASPSFDASLSEIFMALLSGASLYTINRELLDEPWTLRKYMIDNGITVVTFPPSYLRLFDCQDFPGLKVLITAGEAPIAEDIRYYATRCRYFNAYGPTETAVCASLTELKADSCESSVSIGRPLPNTEIHILDRKLRRVAPGIPGELCMAGPGLALGYLNRPELTTSKFVENPFEGAKRIYRSGDVAVWLQNGHIALMGRNDDQLKVRGHRIETGEIKSVLEEHDAISMAYICAFSRSDKPSELTAFIVLRKDHSVTAEDLIAYLSEKIPSYMHPAHFIDIPEMPLTENGKVDKKFLMGIYAARNDISQMSNKSEISDANVKAVVDCYETVLGCNITDTDLHKSFIALGGDSLKAIELVKILSTRAGINVSLRSFMADSSPETIASLENKNTDDNNSTIANSRIIPLTQGQQQLWFQSLLSGYEAQYNMPLSLSLSADAIQIEELMDSFENAVECQPVCRLRIAGNMEKAHFYLENSSGFKVEKLDICNVKDSEEFSKKIIDDFVHKKFDLRSLPLIRSIMIRTAERNWQWLIVMHHIIGDAESLTILLKSAMRFMGEKNIDELSVLELSKFSEREDNYLHGKESEKDLEFLRKQLTPLPPRLNLTNTPRPSFKSGRGDMVILPLTDKVSSKLDKLTTATGKSQLITFTALVGKFLQVLCNEKDIAVAMPVGLRDNANLYRYCGYFVNTVVLRMNNPASRDDNTLIDECNILLDKTLAASRYPFMLLPAALGEKRQPDRAPLVDVLITMIDDSALSDNLSTGKDINCQIMPVNLRASKLDYTFILHVKQDKSRELILEYDTGLADRSQAEKILNMLLDYLGDSNSEVMRKWPICQGLENGKNNNPEVEIEPVYGSYSEITEKKNVSDICFEGESIQLQLADAWQKILGGEKPGSESNFFVLGGDSIKAIQICGILNRQGIHIANPSHFFQYPIFGQFCLAVLENGKNSNRKVKRAVPGTIPTLLPMQRWLFTEHADHWKKFFMLMTLRIKATVNEFDLHRAFVKLTEQHEALRMSFSLGKAYLLSKAPEPYWGRSDLGKDTNLEQRFRDISSELFDKVDPEEGKLIAAHFFRGSNESYLLIAGHHLVLDTVSLQIICQDLNCYIKNENLPANVSDTGIASLLASKSITNNELLDENEIKFWRNQFCEGAGKLISFRNEGIDRAADRISVSRTVSYGGSSGGIDIRSRILNSLAKALYASGQRENIFVKMEGHGRAGTFSEDDLSRTVGWFTITYPFLLKVKENETEIYEWSENYFRNLKHGGATYQLALEKEGTTLAYRASISLNYLGELKDAADDNSIQICSEFLNDLRVPGLLHNDFNPDTPLDLTAFIDTNGDLHLHAWFSSDCIEKQWVDELMQSLKTKLDKEIKTADKTHDKELSHFAAVCMCDKEEIESFCPVSSAQEGMLFQCALDDNTETYTVQMNFRLKGMVNTAILEKAWLLVLQRHENLRSLFPLSYDGNYTRLVLKRCRTTVEVKKLISLPKNLQQQKRAQILYEQIEKKFDLQQGPLITMNLLSYSEQDHEMSWFFHHILMDGWSAGVLLDEIFKTYEALENNNKIPLFASPSVFMNSNNNQDDASDQSSARLWWKETLSGFKKSTFIADSQMSQDLRKTPLKEKTVTPDSANLEALKNFANSNSVSLAHVFQTLWGFILASENNDKNRDVIYGIVSAGRSSKTDNVEKMVGLFMQTLPLRIRWSDSESLIDIVQRVRDQALNRSSHESLHLADIQKISELESPLFDNILVYENYPVDTLSVKDCFEICEVTGREWHPYPLSLSIVPGKKFHFRFNYRNVIISDDKVDEIAEKWLKLIHLVASKENLLSSHIEQQLSSKPITEYKQSRITDELLSKFNATCRSYPSDKSIGEILVNQCRKYPQKKAFITSDGTTLTYADLLRLISAVAAGLKGIKPGEPVAFAMPRGPEAVIVMAAITRAGGCYVPIDNKNPGSRIKTMLKIADCRTVVTWKNGREWFDPEDLTQFTIYDYDNLVKNDPDYYKYPNVNGDMPAYVLYTSGSSGEPKGVLVPHKAVLRLVINSDFWDLQTGERCLQAAPLGFDASTLEIWGALLNGGTLSFVSEEQLLSPGGLKQKIIKDRITMMWLTSSLCNIFADEDAEMFRPLRKLFTGGEALSPSHIKKIADACPELELYNGYGPTENTTFTTVHKIHDNELDGSPIPIGRPISNTRVYIVNENLQVVAPGEWGEICAAGDGLALKYIGRDDLTCESFVQLPAPVNERVYRTGDKGRWRDDGIIEFGGRIDGQVKIRGYRIEMSEIENRINLFPGIMGSAVLGIDKDNEIRLVAFIKSEDRNPDKLLEYLRKHLPEYMVPEQFEYMDMLPFTSNGKMDRKALKSILQQKVEGTQKTVTDNNIEIKVQNIFSDILGKTVVSPDSNFFQLGGHSLKALKLLNRIRTELCKDIDMRTVMENPTPSALAKKIMAQSANFIAPEIIEQQTEESEFFPLNSAQERMWFLQKLQPESTVYTIPFAARIKSEIEPQDIQKAFSLLENRHEALCSRMPEKIEKAPLLQKLVPPGSLIVDYHDFSNMPDAEAAIGGAIYKEREKPFKFGYDEPLIRLSLFRINSNESVLFINIHHIIFDGVSASVLLREIQLAFQAVKEKCTPAWKELPLRYSDYLKDIAGHSQTTEEMKQRWVKRMSPLPESLQLPYDMRRPTKQTFKGESFNFSLSPELNDGIVNLSNEMHVTVFTVLLSIVKVFIYRHTSQKDFVIGVPVAGRTQSDLEEMVGLFVNTLPVRCSIETDMPFNNFVNEVSDRLLDALSDQSLPLEDLINSLDLPRNETRNPLFDILVAMEDSSWYVDRSAQHLKMEQYALPGLHSRMDLSFYFHPDETGINVSIEYSSDLFYHSTIEKMAKRFTQLTQSIIKEPGKSLSSLDLLPLSEKQQVIHEFNSTDENFDIEHAIDEMFLDTVSKHPDSVALRDCNDQVLSYRDLDHRVDLMVSYLKKNGVGKNAHVAVCFERSFELISSIYALMRLGAVYVPVPPGTVSGRIQSMIEDCKDLVVLTNMEFSSLFSDINVKLLRTDEAFENGNYERERISPQAIAYLIYTSGSTGRPKGVMIRHKSVLNRILWMQSRFPLNANDVILQKTPVSFDVSIWELFWWSWTGASLAQLEPSGEGNPALIIDTIYKHKVTVMHFVPSMLRIFLEYLYDHPESVSKTSSLRYVFASGEALSPDLVTLFSNIFHGVCGCELHNLYGPTEATVDVTWYPCTGSGPFSSIPIGKPITNTRIYILDEYKNPQPVGVKGEIHIGGVQVAAGYINQPELTSEKFIDDPFSPGNKLYRTGDLGFWNSKGEVEYSGRIDFQVKLRGFRVELGEIEQALTSLNEISAAVVMVKSINGIDSLEAYIKVSDGKAVDSENIRSPLVNKLPEYMIPYVYHIVENIPLSVNGKVDRRALAAQKTVVSKRLSSNGENRQLDIEVMNIWKLVFPEAAEIQADQNFFELGGNSLLLIRLHELLEKKWPGVFTPADLFVATTIARQAEQIENRTGNRSVNESDKEGTAYSRRDNKEKDAVAIIGMALRLSNYDQIENFWADLLAGADRKTSLMDNRHKQLRQIAKALSYPGDINNITDAAFLDDISGFDNRRFAMSPSDAELLDPEHRLFLETVNRCVEDAGYGGNCLEGCQVGVFAGAVVNNSYKEAAIRSLPDRAEQIFVLNVPSNLATRISYIKNWCGPAALIDTACSSSLKAIHDACTALKNGECELAVAGGVRILLTPVKSGKSFAIESSTGQTRTFDHRADGTGAGEGAVVFLLKPLSKALEDGDSIRAVIRGSAVNQDGRSSSIAAPNPVAQSKVIRAAADDANVELDSVDFFEAHGTGTVLGDPIEIDGLTRAFNGKFTTKKYISSVKGNFGHLDAAAGAIGVAKAVCALQHSIVPGQAHFEKPNPKIDFEHAPVQVADKNVFLKASGHPLRCGVSAFGLSGINAHVILEKASVRTLPPDDGSWMIFVLSADTMPGLRTYAEEIVRCCSINKEWPLHAIAATLVKGRDRLKERAVFYANSREEFLNKLLMWCIEPKVNLPFNKSDKVSPCMVAGIQSSQEAERICEALMKGAEPCWPEGRPIYRVNLPPVPLNRINHWAPFSSADALLVEKFLGEMIISPQNRIFPVYVNKESFWPVSEHKLNGKATMVGMCFPALIGEVSKKIANFYEKNSSSIKIEGLTWISTLQPEILEEGSVQIALTENDNNFMVSLQGLNRIDGWQEFARASLVFISQENKKLDLQLIRKEMKPAGKEFAENDRSENQQVKVSGRWECRKQVWYSEDRRHILARLELDQRYIDDFNNTGWHPAMLDVAVSMALDRPGLIPVSCREIKLNKPHGNQCYSYVKIDDNNDKIDKSLKATCLLLDQEGTIVAEFIDMFFLHAAAPAPKLHKLTWYKSPVEITDAIKSSLETILLLENASCSTAFFDDLSGMGVNITRISRPVSETEYSQISDLIHEKKFSTVVYRIPGNGFRIWELAGLMKAVISKGLREKLKILITGKGAIALSESISCSFNDDPIAATVPAMMLSLSKEEPRLCFRYLEISDKVNASMILNEIDILTDSEQSIVYIGKNGERFVPKLMPVVKTCKQIIADRKYCTVISGGLGAMALTLADTMSELGAGGALALLHRGDFPSEEQWENMMNSDNHILSFRICKLLNLKAKGIKFKIYSCDITDESNLSTCLDRIREELGPVGAVLHTAGVPGDGFLIGKSQEKFENVLAPKITGTNNLHKLTLTDDLVYFILASSRTGLTGAAGQTDYAAANAYLDAFAQWRVAQGLPALSIDWNSWKNIGMAARSSSIDNSMPGLIPEQASDVVKNALLSGETQLVISMTGEDLSGKNLQTKLIPESRINDRSKPGEEKKNMPFRDRIMSIIAEGLGYKNKLSEDDDFYSLGGDSITGMHIVNHINQEEKLNISLADLFSNSRLGSFIDTIIQMQNGPENIAEKSPVIPDLDEYPVSWEQLAILQAETNLNPGTGYNLPQFVKLPDDIDLKKLELAFDKLVKLHEILRTKFDRIHSERPVMRILPHYDIILQVIKIETLDRNTVEKIVTPFKLDEVPLFRTAILDSSKEGRILFFDIHHSLADAKSIVILLSQLFRLYNGEIIEFTGLQQKDAAWLQQNNKNDETEAEKYWLEQYKGNIPYLDLPSDFLRPVRHTFRAGSTSFIIPPELVTSIRSLVRKNSTTSYNFLLSVWSMLFARYASTDDLVIAVAADGRDNEDLRNTPGMFVSLIPLRMKIDENESFSQLLKINQQLNTDAFRYRSYSLNRLLNKLKVPANPDRTVLSEITFSYMNFESTKSADGDFKALNIPNPSTKADLAIFATDTTELLSFSIEYYSDLFTEKRIQRMQHHFLTLLRQILQKGCNLQLRSYSLIENEEKAMIECFKSGPGMKFIDKSIDSLVWINTVKQGNAVIWTNWDGSEINWKDLDRRSTRIAAKLKELGVQTGDEIYLDNGNYSDLPLLMMSIIRCGAFSVLTTGRKSEKEARWFITDRQEKANQCNTGVLDRKYLLNQQGTTPKNIQFDVSPESTAFCIQDSDKNRVNINQLTLHYLAGQFQECGISQGDKILLTENPYTLIGQIQLWSSLLAGGAIVPVQNGFLSKPFESLHTISDVEADVLIAESSELTRADKKDAQVLCRFKRLILIGDEIPDYHLLRSWTQLCPELNIVTALRIPGSMFLMSISEFRDEFQDFLKAGRPMACNQISIIDNNGMEAPIGVWGHLFLNGLVNESVSCVEQLVFEKPWKRTDIVARWGDNGDIELRGLVKDSDCYSALLRSAILEKECVNKVELKRNSAGGWNALVIADSTFDPEQTKRALRKVLPVQLPNFSFEMAQNERAQVKTNCEKNINVKADSISETEKRVIQVFCTFFKREYISTGDSFFDLGGHSLLGLQIINQLSGEFKKELSIKDLYENPSPAELAELLEKSNSDTQIISKAPINKTGLYPLSHAQQRLYVQHYSEGGSVAYNFTFAFRIEGDLDNNRLREALGRLCERHEILRTAFMEKDGQLWQFVNSRKDFSADISFHKLNELTMGDALKLFSEDAVKPFSLDKPGLFRVRCCRIEEKINLLALTMHHIIADGWSMQLFFRELMEFYMEDGKAGLPPLQIQYRDYSVWQQNRDWNEDTAYWKRELSGASQGVNLPADRINSGFNHDLGVIQKILPEQLMERIREFAKKKAVSPATLILSVFATFLYRLTRQEDMVIGMGVAGREKKELEGLIGFFVNILPMRIRVNDETDFDDLIDSVHRLSVEAVSRQDYPYDMLIRNISPDRKNSREALINVMFEYQRYGDLSLGGDVQIPNLPFSVSPIYLHEYDSSENVAPAQAKYDLTLFIQDMKPDCLMRAEFDASIFNKNTIDSWLTFIEQFLTGITDA